MTNQMRKGPLTRVAAIHDLSGFGKCSMTVVLPILSAAGIEVLAMPTAILSTHTGGFEGYTFKDLTEDMTAIAEHWKTLDLKLAAIYSGYLGSPEQVAIVSKFIDDFSDEDTIAYIDPVMADDGKLYPMFDDETVNQMRRLTMKSDLLLPNITEATLLLDEPYKEGPYDEAYVVELLHKLAALGPKRVVLTGIYFDEKQLGAACYDVEKDEIDFAFSDKIKGQFHGTGDVFGSFCLAGLLNKKTLKDSTQMAVDLTQMAIARTVYRETPLNQGVDFEGVLPEMMIKLGKFDENNAGKTAD